jgi:hypothetical protein
MIFINLFSNALIFILPRIYFAFHSLYCGLQRNFFYTDICSYNINNSGFILSTYTMFRVLTSSNIYVLLLGAKISIRMAFTIFIIQWVACDRIPVPFVLWNVKGTKCTQYSEKIFPVFLSTGCPTTYQTRHFF